MLLIATVAFLFLVCLYTWDKDTWEDACRGLFSRKRRKR